MAAPSPKMADIEYSNTVFGHKKEAINALYKMLPITIVHFGPSAATMEGATQLHNEKVK